MESTQAESPEPGAPQEVSDTRAWIPYVAPMLMFMALTMGEGKFARQYVTFYIAKAVFVTATMVICRSAWKDIRFDARMVLPGVGIGLAMCAAWIFIDRWTPHFAFLGGRASFNPFNAIPDPTTRALFIAVRFYGLVLMVPVMEELFWRSFLLRWITEPDFMRLPIGSFSPAAFAMVAAAFGLAHPEWLAAVIFASVCALLLRKTRSLFACVTVHAVTNLALGIYVLTTHHWQYW